MKGVAQNFMQLLGGDLRAARVRIWVLVVVALLLAVPAYLLAPPGGLFVHVGAVVVAAIAGMIWGAMGHRRYQRSIQTSWNRWMRFAVSCETIPEVHRKVQGRGNRNLPIVWAVLLTLAWVAELGLLVLAFIDPADQFLAIPVIAANGLAAGLGLGYFAMGAHWYRAFSASLREMIDDGEIGVWGVM